MFRDDYRNELDKLSLNDEFKQQTIELMKEKSQMSSAASADKTLRFNKKIRQRAAAASAAVIFVIACAGGFMAVQPKSISPDNAYPEETNDGVDALTLGKYAISTEDCFQTVYTVKDALPLSPASVSGTPLKEQSRITYTVGFPTGMGYEGYSCYNASELDRNPAYSVEDEFETLPIYEFVPLSPQTAVENIEMILHSINIGLPKTKVMWTKPVYNENGEFYTIENTVTYDINSQDSGFTLSYIDGNISNSLGENGEFSLWASNGNMRISFDGNLSGTDNTEDILNGFTEKYSGLINFENAATYFRHDYTYSGEKNERLYIYKESDDYGENIFNACVNNIRVTQCKELDTDTVPTKTYFWVSLPYYKKAARLPAISYREALGLLYEGNFYSSYTDTITDDTQVAYIDMAYLLPWYNNETSCREGYSVPFYKFYIQNQDMTHQTDDGIMNEYYVCYVCAVHPDYIELKEDYYGMN